MRAPSLIATLSDAIHIVDELDSLDAELIGAQATVNRSKEFALSAAENLRRQEEWLENEKELCSKALQQVERRLRRQHLMRVCTQAALVPFQLVASTSAAALELVCQRPRRALLRRKLQRRIHAIDSGCSSGLARLQTRINSLLKMGTKLSKTTTNGNREAITLLANRTSDWKVEA
jgi:hypothetical protein